MITATIKEITVNEDRMEAIVENGTGDDETVVVYGACNMQAYPLPGDKIIYDEAGQENALVAFVPATQRAAAGEVHLFARNEDGEIVSEIKQLNTGEVQIKNDNGIFTLSPDGILKLNGDSEPVLLGQTWIDFYNKMTVPTAFGPSGNPTVPASALQLSTKVKLS